MGVTIESKNFSIDLGYCWFNNLRTKIAELTSEDIGIHYRKLANAPYFGEARKEYFEWYNKEITKLSEKYNGSKDEILHFLYASDAEGEMPVEICKSIWEVIKDHDTNVLFGYVGRVDCATFNDFKNIVKDCIDNNCSMVWF